MSRTGRTLSALVAGLLGFALAACSGVAPTIDRVSWQLSLQVSPQNQRHEVLSLLVLAYDKDGLEDLEEAYLVWLEDGTSWWLPNESWKMQESGSDFRWLTHTAIQPISGKSFPRGSYRVLLYDHSGQKASLSFAINLPPTPFDRVPVPTVRALGSGLSVTKLTGQPTTLRGYDYGGALLFEQPLVVGDVSFAALRRQYPELAKLMVDFRYGTLPVRLGPYKVF